MLNLNVGRTVEEEEEEEKEALNVGVTCSTPAHPDSFRRDK